MRRLDADSNLVDLTKPPSFSEYLQQVRPKTKMNACLTKRFLSLLWVLVLTIFVANWLYPPSTLITRSVGIVLFLILWGGLLGLFWSHRNYRFLTIAITVSAVIFVILPGHNSSSISELRFEYTCALKQYRGVKYYWGGESPKGIDCSGLVRRGLIDSFFVNGIKTLNPRLVRYSLWLWWNDCTAKDIGKCIGFTSYITNTPNLNKLDPNTILPGDLAVTDSGSHILANLGDRMWIEADPLIGKVVVISTPSENVCFFEPMKIVRWKPLQ